MKKIIGSSLILLAAFNLASAQNLLINHDFSSPIIGGDNFLSFDDIDGGWLSKNGWNSSTGSAVNQNGWQAGEYGGLSQVVSVATTGTDLKLTFDWTPVAGATTTEALDMSFQIIGWNVTGTPVAGEQMFRGQNYASLNVGALTGSTWDDLLTATVETNAGNANATSDIVTGVAGVSANHTITTAGIDLSNYDYIGVRFASIARGSVTDGDPMTDPGGILDNVVLTAVPEPSTYALIGGVCALGFAMTRRRK